MAAYHRARLRIRFWPAARRAVLAAGNDGVATATRFAYRAIVWRLQEGCRSVLDVGTGLMHSLEESRCPVRLGLDAHRPYLERRRVPEAIPINASALSLEDLFVPGSVDLVTMIDVIEHFEKHDALDLLRQSETVARRRVVLFTPRGHFPQSGYDAFELGGEELQRHRSSWEPEELVARGYRVIVIEDLHGPWNASFVEAFGPDAEPVDALVAWKDAEGQSAS
jgi:hypothetical protein